MFYFYYYYYYYLYIYIKLKLLKFPQFSTLALFIKIKLLKINKALNTVIMSNPISISPQNKPDNLQLLNNTRYKRKHHTLLSLCLCLSFKRKLSLTNTARPIPFSLFLYFSTLLLPQTPIRSNKPPLMGHWDKSSFRD